MTLTTHHAAETSAPVQKGDDWISVASSADRDIEAPINRHGLVVRVVFMALVVALVVMLGGVWEARQLAGSLAVNGAVQRVGIFANDIVEPVVTDGLADGQLSPTDQLDWTVRTRVFAADIVRIKIWNAKGSIVYSDEKSLIGKNYPLDAAEQSLLKTNGTWSGQADLTAPENTYDRHVGPMLEVLRVLHTPDGTPLLFEVSFVYNDLIATSTSIWLGFAAITGISLLLLTLALLPMLRGLVRRLERSQAQREQLLLRAIDASDAERRRIAALLHDGPVQDLVGAGYKIGAATMSVEGTAAGRTLEEAELTMRATVQSLRAMLVDIYPATLVQSGITAALQDLAAGARHRGALVTVSVDASVKLRPDAKHLVFRVAREAIANATKHSGGAPIRVTLRPAGARAMLTIMDGGPGFDAQALLDSPKANHFGLRLLQDAVNDSGIEADLTVRSAIGAGTTWVLLCKP